MPTFSLGLFTMLFPFANCNYILSVKPENGQNLCFSNNSRNEDSEIYLVNINSELVINKSTAIREHFLKSLKIN